MLRKVVAWSQVLFTENPTILILGNLGHEESRGS
jgi:hypothetical protein